MSISFKNWLRLHEAQINYPVLFTQNGMSAVVPSMHQPGGIKDIDDSIKALLRPIAERGIWYEGVGEGYAGGKTESNWAKSVLGVNPGPARSYDKHGNIYQTVGDGLGPAIPLADSSKQEVESVIRQVKSQGGKTVRDVLVAMMTKGGAEGPVPNNKHKEFLDACQRSGIVLDADISQPTFNAGSLLSSLKSAMFKGDGPNMGTTLGQMANAVEVARRKAIADMMRNQATSGLYFLGSGHFLTLKSEHGDLTETPNAPAQPQQAAQPAASTQ